MNSPISAPVNKLLAETQASPLRWQSRARSKDSHARSIPM